MTQANRPEQNNLAVVSLVLGIVSMTGGGILTGIPAIITGSMGLKNPVNKGMSWAGIIMGGISILLTILVVGFFLVLLVIGAFASTTTDPSTDPNYDDTPSNQPFERRST